jgi:hypothetical protein
VRRDLPGRQSLGGQRAHQLIDALESVLVLADQLRVERALPIPRDLDLHRAHVGGHCLRAGPVARVPAVAALGRVGLVAQVLGELGLQSGLEHHLGQPAQQPVRAGQRGPLRLRLGSEPSDQLLIDLVPTALPAGRQLRHGPGHAVLLPAGHRPRLQDQPLHQGSDTPCRRPVHDVDRPTVRGDRHTVGVVADGNGGGFRWSCRPVASALRHCAGPAACSRARHPVPGGGGTLTTGVPLLEPADPVWAVPGSAVPGRSPLAPPARCVPT